MSNFLQIFIFLLLIPQFAFAFGNTTKKGIDEIHSNGGTDILLSPNGGVDINYFSGDKALHSDANGLLQESSTTSTQLEYLNTTTSDVQVQIDSKTPLVRNLNTTDPLKIDSANTATLEADRTFSILQSGAAQDGYLSSTDWNTFNDKQDLISGTDGDLLYFNSGLSNLGIGTNGQYLRVSTLGFPEWADFPTVSPLTAKGDLYTYSTINDRLPVGSDNQLLSANSSTATGLEWVDPPSNSPTTTAGDLIYNNTGSPAGDTRLGIGSEGQVLTVTSGIPSWEDAPTGGGVPLLSKGSLLTSDGVSNGEFSACANGEIIEYDSTEVNGFKCSSKPSAITTYDALAISDEQPIPYYPTYPNSYVNEWNGGAAASTSIGVSDRSNAAMSANGDFIVYNTTSGYYFNLFKKVTNTSGFLNATYRSSGFWQSETLTGTNAISSNLVYDIDISYDGKYIALATSTSANTKGLVIYRNDNGRLVEISQDTPQNVSCDGVVFIKGTYGLIVTCDRETSTVAGYQIRGDIAYRDNMDTQFRPTSGSRVAHPAVSDNGKYAVIITDTGAPIRFGVSSGGLKRPVRQMNVATYAGATPVYTNVIRVALSPSGERVAVCANDATDIVRVYDVTYTPNAGGQMQSGNVLLTEIPMDTTTDSLTCTELAFLDEDTLFLSNNISPYNRTYFRVGSSWNLQAQPSEIAFERVEAVAFRPYGDFMLYLDASSPSSFFMQPTITNTTNAIPVVVKGINK